MRRNLWVKWFGRRPSRPCTPGRRTARPSLEALEDRTLPTVFNVGAGDVATLIKDIKLANGNGDTSNVINLTASTYDLTAVDNNWYGPNGLPPITSNLTIHGNGATIQRDPASNTPIFRLFYVSGGLELTPGSLTMDNVTLEGGEAAGGFGGFGGGGLGAGGAIFNQGTINLVGVTLTGNAAIGGSQSIDAVNPTGGGGMGGVEANDTSGTGFGGSLGGTFGGTGGAGATAGGGGGGGFLTGANGADGKVGGGGIGGGLGGFGAGGGDGGVGGTISGNVSGANGGPGGDFGAGGFAGTAASPNGTTAGGGGGVGAGGGGGGEETSVGVGGGGGFGGGGGEGATGGDGGFGGGGGGGAVAGQEGHGGFGAGDGGNSGGSSAGGGGAGLGGAIFNMGADSAHAGSGQATLINCTLTANTAEGGGVGSNKGGGGGSAFGAAIFNLDGQLVLDSDTVAGNIATRGNSASLVDGTADGGAVYNLAFGNDIDTGAPVTATVVLNNSILANSSGARDLGSVAIDGKGTNTATISGSHNLVTSTSVLVGPGIITQTADPKLGPLQNNGGPTPTMLPKSGSPALGGGDPSLAPSTDQRGLPRPANGPTDAGAVQVSVALSPPPSSPPPGSPPPSSTPPPTLHTPPLLAILDSLLGGVETVNRNDTETVTDRLFGIALFVSTYDSSGDLTSVTIFGINVTFLFESPL